MWGTWDTWATCSKTCDGGVQVRTRKVTTHEENGGTACSGLSTEQQDCNTGTCPAGNVNLLSIFVNTIILMFFFHVEIRIRKHVYFIDFNSRLRMG